MRGLKRGGFENHRVLTARSMHRHNPQRGDHVCSIDNSTEI